MSAICLLYLAGAAWCFTDLLIIIDDVRPKREGDRVLGTLLALLISLVWPVWSITRTIYWWNRE